MRLHRHWWTLAAAAVCMLASVFTFFVGAWPIGIVTFVLYLVAMNRWVTLAERDQGPS